MKEVITPEMAAKILEGNTFNRKVSLQVVKQYAKDMINGQWLYTSDSVKVSPTGRLIDGQHRLEAIILSGASIETQIFYDIEEGVFDKVDHGRKRNAADFLHVNGVSKAKDIAATIRVFRALRDKRTSFLGGGGAGALTGEETLSIYTEVSNYIHAMNLKRTYFGAPKSLINGCMLYHLWLNEQGMVLEFYDELFDGIGREGLGQARMVRDWLIKGITGRKGKAGALEMVDKVLTAFKNMKTGKDPMTIRSGVKPSKLFSWDSDHPEVFSENQIQIIKTGTGIFV